MTDTDKKCGICGASMRPGTTTFTADLGSGVVVVRHVRALVCSQCGEEWLDETTARKLEQIIDDARKRKREIEVTSMA